MEIHNGLRPQDVVILLKILTFSKNDWTLADIADSLKISISEVSGALERCRISGLVNQSKKKVNKLSLRDSVCAKIAHTEIISKYGLSFVDERTIIHK